MTHSFDDNAGARRIAAYTDFLLASYAVDVDGLAEVAGVPRDLMAEYAATTDYNDLNAAVLQKLQALTGISFSWLFAEQGGITPHVEPKRKSIDADDFHDATAKVKACAAALMAYYVQDAGQLTYSPELFEMLSLQLHEAAEYFDGVLNELEGVS